MDYQTSHNGESMFRAIILTSIGLFCLTNLCFAGFTIDQTDSSFSYHDWFNAYYPFDRHAEFYHAPLKLKVYRYAKDTESVALSVSMIGGINVLDGDLDWSGTLYPNHTYISLYHFAIDTSGDYSILVHLSVSKVCSTGIQTKEYFDTTNFYASQGRIGTYQNNEVDSYANADNLPFETCLQFYKNFCDTMWNRISLMENISPLILTQKIDKIVYSVKSYKALIGNNRPLHSIEDEFTENELHLLIINHILYAPPKFENVDYLLRYPSEPYFPESKKPLVASLLKKELQQVYEFDTQLYHETSEERKTQLFGARAFLIDSLFQHRCEELKK
jgi:hypothetical protein